MAASKSERTNIGLDPRLNIVREYGLSNKGNVSKLNARMDVYGYAREGDGKILAAIYGGLALEGSETVIDVGCARGDVLDTIFIKLAHHRGPLFGVDVVHKVLERGKQEFPYINFIRNNAMKLCFPNDSADLITSLFTLYHVPEPELALDEMRRVLKPNGHAIVATSSENNKIRHREYEERVAEYLGVTPPVVYSEPFNADTAKQLLPNRFSVDYHGHQDDEMIFNRSNVSVYLGSLATMYSTCEPRVTQRAWNSAISQVVSPEIRGEIASKGTFVDTIDRHFYLCSPLPPEVQAAIT